MRLSCLYRFLEIPSLYSLWQHISTPGYGFFLKKELLPVFVDSQGLVLDVGCGPSLTTPHPRGTIIGVDINHRYIEEYARTQREPISRNMAQKPHEGKRLGTVGLAHALPFLNNTFDESRSVGLFHHLSREQALGAVNEMLRCTRLGGRVIIVDNVWPRYPLRRPIAWGTRRLDRGQWVRSEEQLLELIHSAYPYPWQQRRFTYTLTGLEAVVFTALKRG